MKRLMLVLVFGLSVNAFAQTQFKQFSSYDDAMDYASAWTFDRNGNEIKKEGFHAGTTEESLNAYEQAERLTNDSKKKSDAADDQGVLYQELKQYKNAELCYERAFQENPNNPGVEYSMNQMKLALADKPTPTATFDIRPEIEKRISQEAQEEKVATSSKEISNARYDLAATLEQWGAYSVADKYFNLVDYSAFYQTSDVILESAQHNYCAVPGGDFGSNEQWIEENNSWVIQLNQCKSRRELIDKIFSFHNWCTGDPYRSKILELAAALHFIDLTNNQRYKKLYPHYEKFLEYSIRVFRRKISHPTSTVINKIEDFPEYLKLKNEIKLGLTTVSSQQK